MASFICVIVLTAFAAIVTLVPDLTLTERLGSAGVILFSGLAAVIALRRERGVEKAEQKARDDSWRRELAARDALIEGRQMAATDDMKVHIATTVEREVAKILAAMTEKTQLAAQGVPDSDPQMQRVNETVRVSTATIQGLVSMGDIFKLPPQGTPAESKAPLLEIPRVPSSGKPPSGS